jgi:hypothetical protein
MSGSGNQLLRKNVIFKFKTKSGKNAYLYNSSIPNLSGFTFYTNLVQKLNPYASQNLEKFNRIDLYAALPGSRIGLANPATNRETGNQNCLNCFFENGSCCEAGCENCCFCDNWTGQLKCGCIKDSQCGAC